MTNLFITRRAEQAFHVTVRLVALTAFVALSLLTMSAHAQTTATLQGAVADSKGGMIPRATVTARSVATGTTRTVKTDDAGRYVITNLPAGTYDISALTEGFQLVVRKGVQVPGEDVGFALQIASATSEVNVDADVTHSVAAALAPMDALLSATSARTEITAAFLQNFTSPVADYGEAVNLAPATFSLNGNGPGLGQSKTYFRGFPDGFYDIDFDGIPFYDTNSPTHHSWAFFPAQVLGSIDFDRSPGTASTIGPTPFGGSIHLLSKDMSPLDKVRFTLSGGSFNTFLYDAAYDSGAFGPGHKFNLNMDVHHLQSHGYQSLNNQTRNSGSLKFVYSPSNTFNITGFSEVIWLDANTPNFNATRCQMYGIQTGYNCNAGNGGILPFTGAGINFLLTNNQDPRLYLDTQYNYYHVPTDFEYVGFHKEFGKGFALNIKPYTYSYDNSEPYANATAIVTAAQAGNAKYINNLPVAPCDVPVVSSSKKTGITTTALPCSVDKYNSYRKYGETSELSQVSRFGIFRAGMWYEWANTNRHQYPMDPTNHNRDQVLPNFAEKFVTNSYQPFAEYQFHIGSKLTVTPGIKFAYYTIGTKQFADDGATIGGLGTNDPNSFIASAGSYFATLPSGDVNYRIKSNWSVYFQGATGSIVPPSSVFDFYQKTPGVTLAPNPAPQQQKNLTFQGGTVLKLKRVTFDADYYHIHFDNSYSSTLDAAGEPVFFLQPSSTTQGIEGESNIYIAHGLSVYLNASFDQAVYSGTSNATCLGTTAVCNTAGVLSVTAPGGLNVQQTPSDIETEGLTYQRKTWDVAFFNRRVGTYYIDKSGYHNQYTVNPFTTANAFVNYTIRSNGRFDQTKLRLSFNNLFNQSSVTGISLAGSATPVVLSANGTTYSDPFNTTGQVAINGQDNVSVLAARSINFSVTFGLSRKGR